MIHTGYHAHLNIKDILQMGDNKIKATIQHESGTASAVRDILQQRLQAGVEHIVLGECKHKAANGSCAGHVLPVEPERDENGYWCHPGVPDFGEDQTALSNWIYEQGLTISTQFLYDEPETSDAFTHYFNDGQGADKWQPTEPAGNGWFMLVLFESDDGPVCWWARHQHDHKVLTVNGGILA